MANYKKLGNGTLFTHREGVLYVEHCRVVASDGMLAFVRAEKAMEKHYSIPHANVCVLLLGPGTSVTQQAAHKMAEQGMMFGFTSGGGAPLFMASQSEYRPTEYCQKWVGKWADAGWRVRVSKKMARARCDVVESCYKSLKVAGAGASQAVAAYRLDIDKAATTPELLGYEAAFAKRLYAYHRGRVVGASGFKREAQGDDLYNKYVDNANYIAYGLAASVLWALGIPHAFAVTHGLTRRGALVFDLADVIKDGVLLAVSFDAVAAGRKENEHRAACLAALDQCNAMRLMFEGMKAWCDEA